MLTHTGKTARSEKQHAALLSKSPSPVISETADPRGIKEALFQRLDNKTVATYS